MAAASDITFVEKPQVRPAEIASCTGKFYVAGKGVLPGEDPDEDAKFFYLHKDGSWQASEMKDDASGYFDSAESAQAVLDIAGAG